MTIADDVIANIGKLPVTQGAGAGEPFQVLDWQAEFIRGVFADDVQVAALSVARGAGKSTLIAAIGLVSFFRPLAQPRGKTYIVSASVDQSGEVFGHLTAFAMRVFGERDDDGSLTGRLTEGWRLTTYPTPRLENRVTGQGVYVRAGNPRTLQGLAPHLLILDEPRQWGRGAMSDGSEAYNTLRTSLGKIPGAKMLVIGTRTPADDHWFSKLCRGEGADYWQVHSGDPNAPIDDYDNWVRANPSLAAMPALEAAYGKDAQIALDDPSQLPAFRADRLNLPVANTEEPYLIELDDWVSKCETEDAKRVGQPVFGLDLGGRSALSSVAAYWPTSGRLEVFAATHNRSLRELGRRHGFGEMYVGLEGAGDLLLLGEEIVPVGELLKVAIEKYGRPAAVVADKFRSGEVRQALSDRGLGGIPQAYRRNQWKEGDEDVRAFFHAIDAGKVNAKPSALLRLAVSESRLAADQHENQRITRKSRYSPNDPMVAALIAVAEGWRRGGQPRRRARYRGTAKQAAARLA